MVWKPVSRLGRILAGIAAVVVVAVAVTTAIALHRNSSGPASSDPQLPKTQLVALKIPDNCDALKQYFVDQTLPLVGPYGVGSSYHYDDAVPLAAEGHADAAQGARSASAPNAAPKATNGTTSDTGTNVQVAGVDEADVAKRVGDLILSIPTTISPLPAVADAKSAAPYPGLRITRTDSAGKTSTIATMKTEFRPRAILVDGNNVLLYGPVEKRWLRDMKPKLFRAPESTEQLSRIQHIDISKPESPAVVKTMDVDGTITAGRMTDGVVRLATTSGLHGVEFTSPRNAPYLSQNSRGSTSYHYEEEADAAEKTNRDKVKNASIDNWLPSYTLTDAKGTSTTGRLAECNTTHIPTKAAGRDIATMVSIDMRGKALSEVAGSAVVASDTTMYANAQHTFLAARSIEPVQRNPLRDIPGVGEMFREDPEQLTHLHMFDTAGRGAAQYVTSNSVRGALLNQFAMDEWAGHLRVATTINPRTRVIQDVAPNVAATPAPAGTAEGVARADSAAGAAPSPAPVSSLSPVAPTSPRGDVSHSAVTVFRTDKNLSAVSRLDGLGTNERIYSVRFMGPTGYVVTFRQIDPLYVLDLSKADKPRSVGELKINGYSAYLHPVSDGTLLGVGQDATDQGRRTGLQVSLFDVTKPENPSRTAHLTIPDANSEVEQDHHAFTMNNGTAVIPYLKYYTGPVRTLPAPMPGQGSASSSVMPMPETGLLVAAVNDGKLTNKGTITVSQPQRTFLDDKYLWVVTDTGVASYDASSLRQISKA